MACPKTMTEDGFETQLGVNHIGHFYFTTLLLPLLVKTGTVEHPARVVQVSSLANFLAGPPDGILFADWNADQHYDPWERYGQAKLANILFAKELNKRFQAQHVVAVALHPGVIMGTELNRHFSLSSVWAATKMLWTGPKGSLKMMLGERQKSIPEGAATSVLCALDPSLEAGGYYYDCHLSQGEGLHAKANDKALAERLWKETEKWVEDALKKVDGK